MTHTRPYRLLPERVSAATETLVAACKVVHPNVSHHPCGDCGHAIRVMRVASRLAHSDQQMSCCDPLDNPPRSPDYDEDDADDSDPEPR